METGDGGCRTGYVGRLLAVGIAHLIEEVILVARAVAREIAAAVSGHEGSGFLPLGEFLEGGLEFGDLVHGRCYKE